MACGARGGRVADPDALGRLMSARRVLAGILATAMPICGAIAQERFTEEQLAVGRKIGAAMAAVAGCPSGLMIDVSSVQASIAAAGVQYADFEKQTAFRAAVEKQKSILVGIAKLARTFGAPGPELEADACSSGLAMYGPSGRILRGLVATKSR